MYEYTYSQVEWKNWKEQNSKKNKIKIWNTAEKSSTYSIVDPLFVSH